MNFGITYIKNFRNLMTKKGNSYALFPKNPNTRKYMSLALSLFRQTSSNIQSIYFSCSSTYLSPPVSCNFFLYSICKPPLVNLISTFILIFYTASACHVFIVTYYEKGASTLLSLFNAIFYINFYFILFFVHFPSHDVKNSVFDVIFLVRCPQNFVKIFLIRIKEPRRFPVIGNYPSRIHYRYKGTKIFHMQCPNACSKSHHGILML